MVNEPHSNHQDRGHGESPLPRGYYKEWSGDFLWLQRPDHSVAGVFSDMGATDEGIADCAWKDSRSRGMSPDDPQRRPQPRL